jgi:DNA-binding GntR family transcriptional regulator
MIGRKGRMGFLERAPSLTDRAADEIRARIVQGVFRLGEPLSEITLANDLGVSKTPVREALLELKRQGLVEVHPQRGTFVFDMNAKDVDKLSEQRAILEIAALRLASAHNAVKLQARWEEIVGDMDVALQAKDAVRYRTLDGDFHLAMFVLSDNPFLLEAYKLIAFRVQALRNRLSLDSALNKRSFKDHVELTAMAVGGMKKRMVALMLSHIGSTRTHYLKELEAANPAAVPVRVRQRFNAA